MGDVYRKVGSRYKKIGMDWAGWPADGIWLVKDGSSSCILRLGDIDRTMPVELLDTLSNAEEISQRVYKLLHECWSFNDVVKTTLAVAAEMIHEQNKSND